MVVVAAVRVVEVDSEYKTVDGCACWDTTCGPTEIYCESLVPTHTSFSIWR